MAYPHYYYAAAHPASAMHDDDDFLQPRPRHLAHGPGPRSFRADPYARLASPSPAPYRPSHAGFYRDAPAHVSPYPPRYYAPEAEDDNGIDALLREEEEARRHLELIQRRREAARVAAERERAERTHRAEYEAFVAAREAAARRAREDAIQREIARQTALAEARARAQAAEQEARLRQEVEKQVKRQILAQQQAKVQAQKEELARQQRQQREIEVRRHREEQLQAQHAAREAFLQHIHNQRQQQQQQQRQAAAAAAAARSACARPRIEGRPSHPLLALFAPEQPCTEEKKQVKPASTPQPVETARTSPPSTPKKDNSEGTAQPSFPQGLNDLLSHFLGLQIEHADDDKKEETAPSDEGNTTKVIDGLNDILGQFGLVFEPEDAKKTSETSEAESSQKVAETKPAAPEPVAAKRPESPRQPTCECPHADNKSFEPAAYGLPDFLKYAFEAAMNDGCPSSCSPAPKKADKGKGVAEGEKEFRAQPAPTPAATEPAAEPKATPADSISKLKSIANEFALARDSFKFPDRLVFGSSATASDPQHPPALLFNKTNSPYYAQTNKLLQLLLAADNVASDGDPAVRQERKALVKELEKEIELLEQKRDQVWEEVRDQRERGEEHIEIESVSSGASVVDPVEHAEQHAEPIESNAVIVEAPIKDTTTTEAAQPDNAPQPIPETAPGPEVAGFDVPAAPADKTPEPEQHTEAVESDAKAESQVDEKPAEKESEPTTPLPELERKQSRQATVEDETKEDEYEVL